MGTASVLAEVVGGAGFLFLAVAEVLLMTGIVSLEVTLALGIAVEVAVEVVLEMATLIADVVETGVAVEEGVVVDSLERELADVVEAGLASMALLADDFALIIIREI